MKQLGSRFAEQAVAATAGSLGAFALMVTYTNTHLGVMRDVAAQLGDAPFFVAGAALLLSGAMVGELVYVAVRATVRRARALLSNSTF